MLRFIVGVPGAGKTMFALHRALVSELVGTKRMIVTNLTEIKLPELAEFMAERYKIDITGRIQIIPKECTREFYRYRGKATMASLAEFDSRWSDDKLKTMLPEVRDEILQKYFAALADLNPSGVCYIMDECHRHFKAIEWTKVAYQVDFYMTQLRHLNDWFWAVTQNPEQVVASFRRLAQDCFVLRNHYLESFSVFKKPGGFWWRQYNYVPDARNAAEQGLQDSGKLMLDVKGLANCYNTRGALGKDNAIPDTKEKSRKLPYWVVFAAAACFIGGTTAIFISLPKFFGKAVGGFMGQASAAAKKAAGIDEKPVTIKAERNAEMESPRSLAYQAAKANNPLRVAEEPAGLVSDKSLPLVTGTMWTGNRYRVTLSNGNVLTDVEGQVERIDPAGVVLKNGDRLRYKPVAPSGKPPSPPRTEGQPSHVEAPKPVQSEPSSAAPAEGGPAGSAQVTTQGAPPSERGRISAFAPIAPFPAVSGNSKGPDTATRRVTPQTATKPRKSNARGTVEPPVPLPKSAK